MEASGIRVWGDIKVLREDSALIDRDADRPAAGLRGCFKPGDRHLGQKAEGRRGWQFRVWSGQRNIALWVEPLDGQAVARLDLLGDKPKKCLAVSGLEYGGPGTRGAGLLVGSEADGTLADGCAMACQRSEERDKWPETVHSPRCLSADWDGRDRGRAIRT